VRVPVAVLCGVSAVVGAAIALAVGAGSGWLGGSSTTVLRGRLTDAGLPAAVVAARPLAGNGFQPAQIYRARAAGVVTILSSFAAGGPSETQGSGVVVARSGRILTDAPVITTAGQGAVGNARAARAVYVQFADGDRVPARIVGYDLYDDVGVLRVDPADHAVRPVPLGRSAGVVVGAPVAAIGSPFGNADSLTVGVARGALVDAVRAGSPAAQAGLRAGTHDVLFEGLDVRVGGDVIVAIDGAPVRSAADVVRIVSGRLLPGQTARLTIERAGKRLVLPVRLAARTGAG
jgi:S1-C subfamily serine protease